MEPSDYSDPVVIPITITVPDPRPRRRGGRWDLGPSYHPSFTDPDWFNRQRPLTYAQMTGAIPRYVPFPPPPPTAPAMPGLDEAVERARRRAQHAAGEIGRGELGAAAGHLLGGQPFPAELDDPAWMILHNQATPSRSTDGRARLHDLIDETNADLDARRADGLDERHLRDAEGDRTGNPVIKDGKEFDHENEVAQSKQGLEQTLAKLQKKLLNDRRYGVPEPDAETIAKACDNQESSRLLE